VAVSDVKATKTAPQPTPINRIARS
jgi:hypothetical protein